MINSPRHNTSGWQRREWAGWEESSVVRSESDICDISKGVLQESLWSNTSVWVTTCDDIQVTGNPLLTFKQRHIFSVTLMTELVMMNSQGTAKLITVHCNGDMNVYRKQNGCWDILLKTRMSTSWWHQRKRKKNCITKNYKKTKKNKTHICVGFCP